MASLSKTNFTSASPGPRPRGEAPDAPGPAPILPRPSPGGGAGVRRLRRACTSTEHGRITSDPERWQSECRDHRPWPGADLIIAECVGCRSTLAVEVGP